MPTWSPLAYICLAISALVNIGSTLLPMYAVPALLWEGNPWSAALLAPTLVTVAAALFVGRRCSGVLGRSIMGGWAIGLTTLIALGFVVALGSGA